MTITIKLEIINFFLLLFLDKDEEACPVKRKPDAASEDSTDATEAASPEKKAKLSEEAKAEEVANGSEAKA